MVLKNPITLIASIGWLILFILHNTTDEPVSIISYNITVITLIIVTFCVSFERSR